MLVVVTCWVCVYIVAGAMLRAGVHECWFLLLGWQLCTRLEQAGCVGRDELLVLHSLRSEGYGATLLRAGYARKAGCSLAGLVTTSSLPLAGVDKLSKASTTSSAFSAKVQTPKCRARQAKQV
ncbi:hypothetical protein V8C86DRAFT_1613877 [Haematococcus lacustris]